MKRFIKSSAILAIGDLFTKILSILYLVPLVKINDTFAGIIANLIIIFGMVIVFTSFGINIIIGSEVSKYHNVDDNKLKSSLVNGFIIIFSISLIATTVMYTFAAPLVSTIEPSTSADYNYFVRAVEISALGVLLFTISSYFRSVLAGLGKYKTISIETVVEQLIKVSIVLGMTYYCYVLNDYDIGYMYIITAVSILASLVFKFVYLAVSLYLFDKFKIFFKGKYDFDSKTLRVLLYSSLIYFFGSLYITFFDYIDEVLMKVLYGANHTQEQLAVMRSEFFSLSYKIVMIPIQLSVGFITVMIREMNISSDDKKKNFDNILDIMLIYGIVGMLLVWFIGQDTVSILYPGATTIGIIRFQAMIIPVYIIKNIITSYIVTNDGKGWSIISSTIIVVIIKIILSVMLYPVFGVYGFILGSFMAVLLTDLFLMFTNKHLFRIDRAMVKEKTKIVLQGVIIFIAFFVFKEIIDTFELIVVLDLIVKLIFALLIIGVVFRKYLFFLRK